MEEKLQKVADDFLKRVQEKLPAGKADKPFIVGIVGMIGSGKTTFCWELIKHLKGAVMVQSNGGRYLLERPKFSWGPTVRETTFYVARWCLENGYTVVFDGDHVDEDKRENTQKLADELGVKFYLLHLKISPETAEKRLDEKYSQPHEENFWDYWLDTNAEDMKQNMRDRIPEHEKTEQEKPKYFAEFENKGTKEGLKQKAVEIAKKIQE
jgi:predicted kinase